MTNMANKVYSLAQVEILEDSASTLEAVESSHLRKLMTFSSNSLEAKTHFLHLEDLMMMMPLEALEDLEGLEGSSNRIRGQMASSRDKWILLVSLVDSAALEDQA